MRRRRRRGGALTLEHALWIGGPPGSGKTTLAGRLARRHGLRLYSADTLTWAHRDRALAAGSAAAHRWEALTPAERRRLSPEEALELSLHAERGPMVVDDVRLLPASPLVVAEGSTLPASVVSTGVVDRSRTLWLIPTEEFQRAQLAERGLPAAAAALYHLLAETIACEAREHDVHVLAVDGTRGIEDAVTAVERHFADALAAGPHTASRLERRALLREANDAIAAQLRAFYARPWSSGDAETAVRTFGCECGDRGCTANVELAVGALAAAPALAPGHED